MTRPAGTSITETVCAVMLLTSARDPFAEKAIARGVSPTGMRERIVPVAGSRSMMIDDREAVTYTWVPSGETARESGVPGTAR